MRDFMGGGGIEISAKDVYKMIDRLKEKVDKEVMMKALTLGGIVLRDGARERLLTKMPKAQSGKGREKNTTMVEGIRVSKNESGGYVNVYILGNYLNSWFELGTDDRYLKRGHQFKKKGINRTGKYRQFQRKEYRGRLTALHFFREAKTEDMQKVMDKIIEIVDRGIDKIIDE